MPFCRLTASQGWECQAIGVEAGDRRSHRYLLRKETRMRYCTTVHTALPLTCAAAVMHGILC